MHKTPEIDPALAEATKSKDEAIKARAKANHAVAVVLVSTQALAAAQVSAAELLIAAGDADKTALEHATKARLALEKQLGLAHDTEKVVDKVTTEKAEVTPV